MAQLTPGMVATRIRIAVEQMLPDRPVRRTVRGIDMLLPRRHLLPYFAASGSPYAENLVDLARGLADLEGSVCLLDVGANVGDSALFVLDQVPGSAVCVEPDPRWIDYLDANVGEMPNVAVERSVLLAPDAADEAPLSIVRADVGTSRVERSDSGEGLATVTTDGLLRRHPQLADVRLVKTDTDGYDVMLVPAMARSFAGSRPVIFFEFDPRPTLLATPHLRPSDLWPQLVRLGYERAVLWWNTGTLIGPASCAELEARTSELEEPRQVRGFWDVAVAHRDDLNGLKVLDRLAGAAQSG